MKRYIFPILICFISISIFAQSDRAVVQLFPTPENGRWASPTYEIPLQNPDPFISYFLGWEGQDGALNIRFSEDGLLWTNWMAMPRDEHSPELPLSIMNTTEVGMRFFQVKDSDPESTIRSISCHFYSPGATERVLAPGTINRGRSCSDLAPAFLMRSGWCPSGNCSEHPNPTFAEVSHLVIHHSAGTNQSSDWSAVVRSIWDFHVNGRGWSDIGYNWLVDPQGQVYQGRSNDAIGAHFCGTNTGTIGICVLGDFTNVSPKTEAIAALKELLSWKACENGIDPLGDAFHASSGINLPTIIGHRDGCATACPGDLFYPQLQEIRTSLTNDQTTSVRNQEEWLSFQVYPNPSRGPLRIVLPENAPQELQLSLYDLLGRRLAGASPLKYDQQMVWDVSVPNGTYFLVLESKESMLGVKKVSIFY